MNWNNIHTYDEMTKQVKQFLDGEDHFIYLYLRKYIDELEHELTELKKQHSAEANANTVLGDVGGACCKCGNRNVKLSFVTKNENYALNDGFIVKANDDLLYCRCRQCDYRWIIPCKDSETDTGHVT